MSLGFDLSVNNYTIEDLLTLLGLGSNPSIPEVNNKLNIFMDMFTGISGESSGEIINFFEDVGERLNEDFFEATEFQPENLFNYVEPHMMDNAISVTRPFPHMLDMDNGISPEDLIVCRDVDVDEEQEVSTREDGTFIIDVPSKKEKHYNYEFTVENLDVVTDVDERTTFKYSFNELLTDVKELYLSQIVIPLPYTISSYKQNNRFTITDVSSGHPYDITIEDSYLIHQVDIQTFVTYLNNEYFLNPDNSGNILGNITLSLIQKASSQRNSLRFELSNNPLYSTFTLSFDISNQFACFNPVYGLNKILGFNLVYENVNRVDGDTIFLTQPKIYFSLDDNQINFNQNLRTLGNSIGVNNILGFAFLNSADLVANNYIIINVFSTTQVTQNGRIYNGPVNLDTFTVRFYDVNKILQQIPLAGFDGNCFYFTLLIKRLVADINGD